MDLILIKSIVVVILVLSLATVAEKVSTKISGILSGLPLGALIVLLFFAIEYGSDYTQVAALYNIHGLFASLAFTIGYYISTFYTGKYEIIFSLVISFIFYGVVAFIISFIPIHIIITPIIVTIFLLLSAVYFSKKENYLIVKASKTSIYDVIVRSILTIFIFLIISSLPMYMPVNYAGVFSSFPTVLLPLLIIIHFNHSNLQARTIIKNTPFGLTTIVWYSYIVYYAYPTIGITLGTILGLITAFLVIYIQLKIFRFLNIK